MISALTRVKRVEQCKSDPSVLRRVNPETKKVKIIRTVHVDDRIVAYRQEEFDEVHTVFQHFRKYLPWITLKYRPITPGALLN